MTAAIAQLARDEGLRARLGEGARKASTRRAIPGRKMHGVSLRSRSRIFRHEDLRFFRIFSNLPDELHRLFAAGAEESFFNLRNGTTSLRVHGLEPGWALRLFAFP